MKASKLILVLILIALIVVVNFAIFLIIRQQILEGQVTYHPPLLIVPPLENASMVITDISNDSMIVTVTNDSNYMLLHSFYVFETFAGLTWRNVLRIERRVFVESPVLGQDPRIPIMSNNAREFYICLRNYDLRPRRRYRIRKYFLVEHNEIYNYSRPPVFEGHIRQSGRRGSIQKLVTTFRWNPQSTS